MRNRDTRDPNRPVWRHRRRFACARARAPDSMPVAHTASTALPSFPVMGAECRCSVSWYRSTSTRNVSQPSMSTAPTTTPSDGSGTAVRRAGSRFDKWTIRGGEHHPRTRTAVTCIGTRPPLYSTGCRSRRGAQRRPVGALCRGSRSGTFSSARHYARPLRDFRRIAARESAAAAPGAATAPCHLARDCRAPQSAPPPTIRSADHIHSLIFCDRFS